MKLAGNQAVAPLMANSNLSGQELYSGRTALPPHCSMTATHDFKQGTQQQSTPLDSRHVASKVMLSELAAPKSLLPAGFLLSFPPA